MCVYVYTCVRACVRLFMWMRSLSHTHTHTHTHTVLIYAVLYIRMELLLGEITNSENAMTADEFFDQELRKHAAKNRCVA